MRAIESTSDKPHRIQAVIWAASAAFMSYSFMYAFRKPISAATFPGLALWGVSYKVIVVITQVVGYLSAKFFGIKIISELPNQGRRRFLLLLIGISWLGLLLFAVTPYPYNFIWILINGFPLGLIWGIVFSYIEGRNSTDALATFLSISFIFSSGIVKSIGRYLTQIIGISEFWMPFLVGALFVPLILLSSWMLEKIPPPSEADKANRTPRVQLNRAGRKRLFQQYQIGLLAILVLNAVLTIVRDIKDNFLVEIWESLQVNSSTSIYAQIESIVSVIILILLAGIVFIKNNKNALKSVHLILLIGLLIVMISTYLFAIGSLSALTWMVLHGVGLYLSYIAFQSLYYERFIAAFKVSGNVGFLIYIADFVGYIGSVLILLMKEFAGFDIRWDVFIINLSYVASLIGIAMIIIAHIYFTKKLQAIASSYE